ncbi:hypothetical protein E2C01_038427 [Portunus trituberculatus]|uniref:Uncharacterized protein n=1 Tax=Portunus trituberculatus TaxID=210409 RepID=A0A5B7FGS9_PORTR|nr:hypothetical protein [Portunus trituberculatus]
MSETVCSSPGLDASPGLPQPLASKNSSIFAFLPLKLPAAPSPFAVFLESGVGAMHGSPSFLVYSCYN